MKMSPSRAMSSPLLSICMAERGLVYLGERCVCDVWATFVEALSIILPQGPVCMYFVVPILVVVTYFGEYVRIT